MFSDTVTAALLLGRNFDYILFRIAIFFAEAGQNVWCISTEPFVKVPNNIVPPEKEILKLITFMYLKDYKELFKQLNGIHLWHKMPNAIIITGFEKYTGIYSDTYNPSIAALITANILDSAFACSAKKNAKVFVLVTCEEPRTELELHRDKLKVLQDLYFPNVLHSPADENTDERICNDLIEIFK